MFHHGAFRANIQDEIKGVLTIIQVVGNKQLVFPGLPGFEDQAQVAQLVHDEVGGVGLARFELDCVGIDMPVFRDQQLGGNGNVGSLFQPDRPGAAGLQLVYCFRKGRRISSSAASGWRAASSHCFERRVVKIECIQPDRKGYYRILAE